MNGQPLEVLERGRRFLKVKTEKNEIGWIEDHAVIDAKTYDGFLQLAQQHKDDPGGRYGYPARRSYHAPAAGPRDGALLSLAGNAKVQLLARASAPKKPPAPMDRCRKRRRETCSSAKSRDADRRRQKSRRREERPLASGERAAGDGRLVAGARCAGPRGLAAGQPPGCRCSGRSCPVRRGSALVGCWLLTKVTDPEADTPNHQVPEYLTVLAPLKSGMPFDFDQVRVFTWSLKHHRYETAFRLHPIRGFLPVRVFTEKSPEGASCVQLSHCGRATMSPPIPPPALRGRRRREPCVMK